MDILLSCLVLAVLLPIISKVPVGIAMARQGRYDNKLPRVQQQALTGFGLRAKAAHENSFEALTMFAPGILATLALEPEATNAAAMAIGFIISRIGYMVMYWYDFDIMRSLFWSVGFGCSLGLLLRLF